MFQYKNTKPMPDFQLKKVKFENKFTFFQSIEIFFGISIVKREIEIGFLLKKQA